jgi:hypothetical protein
MENFNAATSYKDKLYIGINLNSHFTDFRKQSSFYEDNNAPLSQITLSLNCVLIMTYILTEQDFLSSRIYKVTNEMRVGLAYESSTWYNLSDELSQN